MAVLTKNYLKTISKWKFIFFFLTNFISKPSCQSKPYCQVFCDMFSLILLICTSIYQLTWPTFCPSDPRMFFFPFQLNGSRDRDYYCYTNIRLKAINYGLKEGGCRFKDSVMYRRGSKFRR